VATSLTAISFPRGFARQRDFTLTPIANFLSERVSTFLVTRIEQHHRAPRVASPHTYPAAPGGAYFTQRQTPDLGTPVIAG
jgi:hypothetical protein